MPGFFPMFVRLAGRIVVVIGGGDLAVRTVEALLACDAEVRVITPSPSPRFSRFRGVPNLLLITRPLEHGDLEDALLAIAVDDDPAVNVRAAREGLEWNVLVSVADELALSDFVVPSFVHRGGLTLALHAGRASARLAGQIGEDLERALGAEYGDYVAALERALDRIDREVPDAAMRRRVFERVLGSDLRDALRQGGGVAADAEVDRVLSETRVGTRPVTR